MSAVALGAALQINNGFYTPTAISLVGAGLVLAWAALLIPRWLNRLVPDRDRIVTALLIAGLVAQIAELLTSPFAMYAERPWPSEHAAFIPLVMLAALAMLAAAVGPARWLRAACIVLLIAFTALARVGYRASPNPRIDVVTVHQAAIKAIAHGRSPYSITFPDIYRGQQDFYPPGAVQNGMVNFGYPYPILSLLMTWLGQRVWGDFRYAELASLVIGSGAIAAAGGVTRVSVLAVGLLLFTPRVLFQLEQAWTEPLLVLWFGLALWGWRRQWMRLAMTALALSIAVKQYLIVAAPLAWLMPDSFPDVGSAFRRTFGSPADRGKVRLKPDATVAGWMARLRAPIAIGLIAAVTFVPVLLWDAGGFMRSAVLVQVNEKLRADALSFAVTYMHAYGHEMSALVYVSIVGVALLLAMWRAPRTPAGFSAALAVVLFTTFAFGKKAFCNYYFFVVVALCAAVAVAKSTQDAAGPPPDAEPDHTAALGGGYVWR